jgi:hypothetical protein
MNKLLLTISLAIFSTSTMAEWTVNGDNDDFTAYFDKASVSRKGNVARIWELRDFKSKQNQNFGTFLSAVIYWEYNCANKMSNILGSTAYSEKMAAGKVLLNYKNDKKEWDYIIPNTMGDELWKKACGKN